MICSHVLLLYGMLFIWSDIPFSITDSFWGALDYFNTSILHWIRYIYVFLFFYLVSQLFQRHSELGLVGLLLCRTTVWLWLTVQDEMSSEVFMEQKGGSHRRLAAPLTARQGRLTSCSAASEWCSHRSDRAVRTNWCATDRYSFRGWTGSMQHMHHSNREYVPQTGKLVTS